MPAREYSMALAVGLLTLSMALHVAALSCIKIDECSCKFDDLEGAVISMRPLLNRTMKPPLFKDYQAADGSLYSYNPCNTFSEGNCTDSTICQLQSPNGTARSLVDQKNLQIGYDNISVTLTYVGKDALVQAIVSYVCVENQSPPIFTAWGLTPSNPPVYQFRVESGCACKNSCIQSPSSSSLSGGTVVIIVFFTLLLLYLIVGSVYGKVVKNASGVEVLPNYHFWVGLPNTLKTGSLCIVRFVCCKPDRKKYDEV